MRIITFLALLFSTAMTGQDLAVTTFGKASDPAIIFFHGGPGYNSVSFERSTADSLAARGFYVISYDRRGEGRSEKSPSAYNFAETQQDLLGLYERFGLSKASLIGHSFGGVVALKFAERYPERIAAIVLASAPLSMQQVYTDILTQSRMLYEAKQDSVNLNYLDQIARMDTSILQYSSYAFAHAMQNGFYQTPTPTPQAKALYAELATDTLMLAYQNKFTFLAPPAFWGNERYTTIDLRAGVSQLGVPVYGIYGEHDGLFSAATVGEIGRLIGEENLLYLKDASHGVFIDRRTAFLDALSEWLR